MIEPYPNCGMGVKMSLNSFGFRVSRSGSNPKPETRN
jgi:hypothetical protein